MLCHSSHKLAYNADEVFARERFRYIVVGALPLGPEPVAFAVLGTDQDDRNIRISRVPFQFAARLEAVALGHDHIHQDEGRPLHLDHLLDPQRIVDRDREVSTFIQNGLDQPDFRWRIVDNQNLFQADKPLRKKILRNTRAIAQPSWCIGGGSDRKI